MQITVVQILGIRLFFLVTIVANFMRVDSKHSLNSEKVVQFRCRIPGEPIYN